MVRKNLFKFIIAAVLIFIFSSSALAGEGSISTYAGAGETGYKDGKSAEAVFSFPYGITLDNDGGLIVVDSYNNRIRKVRNGMVSTIAGFTDKKDSFGFPQGGYADRDVDKAMFNRPRDAVVDSKGNIFISDTGNNVIRVISNGIVNTFAGTGAAGYNDGKAAGAKFNTPSGLAIDKDGNLYVADSLNHVIRKITIKGEVITFAGKNSPDGGYKDGPAQEALFNEPADVAMDKSGILYILDSGNQLVRVVNKGEVSTFSGSRGDLMPGTAYIQGGFGNGYGGEVKYNFPKGIGITDEGIVFIADTWNHRIRAIKPDGSVVTIAGTGIPGKRDGTLTEAMLDGPVAVVYNSGSLYISDMWNNCIRVLTVRLESLSGIIDRNELIQGISFGPPADQIQVWFNKKKIYFPDVKPYKSGKKIFVPLKPVCGAWGADMQIFSKSGHVRIKKGKFYKRLAIDNKSVILDGGNIMVETQYLSKNLGMRAEWIREYNAVVMTTKK